MCVCLSSLYDQDVLFLAFVVLSVVGVVVSVIVVSNQLLGMDWSVVTSLGTIIWLSERGLDVGGLSFMWLSPLIRHHHCCAHSRGELSIWKGLVFLIPSGHHCLTPGGRSGSGWGVICRVSFVRLYPLFRRRRCRTHSCQAFTLGKVWVDCNPSGHYHMRPGGKSGRGLSCLSTTLSYFLLSS